MSNSTMSIVVAGAFAAALGTLAATTANAAGSEKCFGVAMKGQNDCKAGAHACKGHSTVSYDGQSFKLVAKGTCVAMKTPYGPGSLKPVKRPT